MVIEYPNLSTELFGGLENIMDYARRHKFDELLTIDLNSLSDVESKVIYPPYFSVSESEEAYPPEIDDLVRLHFAMLTRRVTTVLEFGVGKSTIVLSDALAKNQLEHELFVRENLRRFDAWRGFSVDTNPNWIEVARPSIPHDNFELCASECELVEFAGRYATVYKRLPNVAPDFIYIDGPDQKSASVSVRGFNTDHPDRLPMIADILAFEHFLLPGTLMIFDGRTANARFIAKNLQRDWFYFYDEVLDQSFFELTEDPLGVYNRRQLVYQLGDAFFDRVALMKMQKQKVGLTVCQLNTSDI